MGSPGPGAADSMVGSIVWVRRRNGSWWPGKILDPEELDATHLSSPRSGTPVKLLGREDASVDWYNLEKSKRVKAFRCGDFDDCIKGVESSQGNPIRKREKYARREDAILHALELEKELLRKQGNLLAERISTKSSSSANEEIIISGPHEVSNGKPERIGNLRPNHFRNTLSLQKQKEEDQPGLEDDPIEVAPRMRGLQDFGLKTATSKRKAPSSSGIDASFKAVPCNDSPASSSGDLSMERSNHVNGKEQCGGASRSKISRFVYPPAESVDALDCKGTSSSQLEILPSSFGVGDSHPRRRPATEENTSEFMEDVESDSSDSESDSSETEEDTDDDIAILSGLVRRSEPGPDAFGRQMMAEDEITSSEEHFESSLSGDTSYPYHQDPVYTSEAVSKWRLKGKRNVRSLAKRSMDKADARQYNESEHGVYYELDKTAFGRKLLGHGLDFHRINELSDGTDDTDISEKDSGAKIVGPGKGGYMHPMKAAFRSRNNSHYEKLEWDDDPWEGCLGTKRRWEDKIEIFDQMFNTSRQFDGRTRSMLIDVDLEVQASYPKAPIPIVSLMSKLDGRAIIGHPVQIEVLADGSSDSFLHTSDYFNNNETIYHDRAFTLPPAWRTARRSNSRVPRPRPSSSVEPNESTEDRFFIDPGERLPFKKLNLGSRLGNNIRKGTSRIPRLPADKRQQQKKLPKKASALASQKTRALSSIGIEQRHGIIKPLQDSSNCQMDTTDKPVSSSGRPTVACIPVKLVFSRLLEKINRPPSKAAGAKGVLSNSDIP